MAVSCRLMGIRGVAVVLGCRVLPNGSPSPALQRRIERAVTLYENGECTHLLASGGRRWGAVTEAESMCREFARLGVPPRSISSESESHNTRQNAAFSTRVLLCWTFEELLLVTCDFHMPRALAEFERHGWRPKPRAVSSPALGGVRAHMRGSREFLGLLGARMKLWCGC
jgi:uncharacterized SAM-binding protein YcdF (DUF218 family)